VRDHASWRRRPQGLKLVDASPADVERTWPCVSGCECEARDSPGATAGKAPRERFVPRSTPAGGGGGLARTEPAGSAVTARGCRRTRTWGGLGSPLAFGGRREVELE